MGYQMGYQMYQMAAMCSILLVQMAGCASADTCTPPQPGWYRVQRSGCGVDDDRVVELTSSAAVDQGACGTDTCTWNVDGTHAVCVTSAGACVATEVWDRL